MSSRTAGTQSRQPFDTFSKALTANFASLVKAQPEDQLKAPVQVLLKDLGATLGKKVIARTEAQVAGLGGRPDVGVDVEGLLNGYIELKAPGYGARAENFKGTDKGQWDKFKTLPNLIYTDGNEWSLYRTGELTARARVTGDVTKDGPSAISDKDGQKLTSLLTAFFSWGPIVPSSPEALAQVLAPLCHLLREDVFTAVQAPSSNLASLAKDWRNLLFPDADDLQFADAYAQTVTYALLLARLSGQTDLTIGPAASSIDKGHSVLAQALRLLADAAVLKEIGLAVGLLQRAIAAIDVRQLTKGGRDPWLYFYEDFLAAYDPKLRNDRGVYYTPVEVVRAQVRLVAELLSKRFSKALAFADDGVVLLDPGVGTGSYPLSAMTHGLDLVVSKYGPGDVGDRASEMANNMHAFEILVGPYAVAHLRLTEQTLAAGGQLPSDGVHVYLTDTLESPHASPPGWLPLSLKVLGDEHMRALKVKSTTRVLVCMGNPPYDRQQIGDIDVGIEKRKGGWVRFGDDNKGGILESFLAPARAAGAGVHLKNLYNDYVYFWRWALWKVFDSTGSPGIVSFITASSYLRGPGFVGMRTVMRQTLDELYILDLEGDNKGPRKTENVFAIETPVAIAIGVRYGFPNPSAPAKVWYGKITGARHQKLSELAAISSLEDVKWRECYSDWTKPFLPVGVGDYYSWPLLTDIFPWQQPGVKAGRTWPIAPLPDILKRRWQALVSAPAAKRRDLFKDSPTGQKVDKAPKGLTPISKVPSTAPLPPIRSYAFRSFDRQLLLNDPRLIDRISPSLWAAHGDKQVYLSSLLTEVLGEGPAAVVAADVPDLHYFRGSFGGKDVIPLYRDPKGTQSNITKGLLDILSGTYGERITAEDLFAYCYAILAAPDYAQRFSEELVEPGPRIPVTQAFTTFKDGADLGRELVWLHSYGRRFIPTGKRPGDVPAGSARAIRAVPSKLGDYPSEFSFDEARQVMVIGKGEIGPVTKEVWDFSVSGLHVVKSWLSYRMLLGAGRKSSDLDEIRPERWTASLTEELLQLLWLLEATVKLGPQLDGVLDRAVKSPTVPLSKLPLPNQDERAAPIKEQGNLPLLDRMVV